MEMTQVNDALDRWRDSTWELIKSAAPLDWQIAAKLTVLRELLEDAESSWGDRRDRAMLESIRIDVESRG